MNLERKAINHDLLSQPEPQRCSREAMAMKLKTKPQNHVIALGLSMSPGKIGSRKVLLIHLVIHLWRESIGLPDQQNRRGLVPWTGKATRDIYVGKHSLEQRTGSLKRLCKPRCTGEGTGSVRRFDAPQHQPTNEQLWFIRLGQGIQFILNQRRLLVESASSLGLLC